MDVSKPDFEAGLDGLQADMAEHQRRYGDGGEVTAAENKALAADAIRRLERELADAPPAPADHAPQQLEVQPSITRKEVDGKAYTVTRMPGDIEERAATQSEAWFLRHALPRIAKLLSLREPGLLGTPSWRDRALAVMLIQEHAQNLKAAIADPRVFAKQRDQVAKMPPADREGLFKLLGIESIADLTPRFAQKKAEELSHMFLAELRMLLDESDRLGFGSWKADVVEAPEEDTAP